MAKELRLLAGVKVVDLGFGMAAALASKYFADAGAEVLRIEPVGGDPFLSVVPGYDVWRRNAKPTTRTSDDAAFVDAALEDADVCILGGDDHPDLPVRISASELSIRHPRLVVLEIAGDPLDGAKPAVEVLAQARSGVMYEQFSDRPIYLGFQPATYGAALQGICGTLAALYERETSGEGQVVTTSLFEGAVCWMPMLWSEFEHPPERSGPAPLDTRPLILKCADGVYVHLVIGTAAGSKYGVYQALGIDDPAVTPETLGNSQEVDPKKFFGDVDLLQSYAERFDSAELLRKIWSQGLAGEPVLDPGECWSHPQLEHNGLLKRHADGLRSVGFPLIVQEGPSGGARQVRRGSRPLEGIRAVDFGAYVAGPTATMILGDLGADVIKVEPLQGEPCRNALRVFTGANHGKRAIALNMKSPEGVRIAQELCRDADVVTSNFRPGVSARLGVDPASLHALRPGLIVLESPAYGSIGPAADKAGYDPVMQALCGHEKRAGGEGASPLSSRMLMIDTTNGFLGTIGLLSALYHRARTGKGVTLEAPLLNAGVFLLSELIQLEDGTFRDLPVLNAERTGFSPAESIYKATDGWLAIAVRNKAAAEALAVTLGLSSGLEAAPASWGETEAKLIAAAVAERPVAELSDALDLAGVWNEPCRRDTSRHFLSDPGLAARGTVRVSAHPRYGRVRELGLTHGYSRSSVGSTRPLADIGEHSAEILADIGRSPEQIAVLRETGIVR